MLHPASDCYKRLGFITFQHEQLEYDDQQRVWRCFYATKQGQIIRVWNELSINKGKVFTDTSSWYWQAELRPQPRLYGGQLPPPKTSRLAMVAGDKCCYTSR